MVSWIPFRYRSSAVELHDHARACRTTHGYSELRLPQARTRLLFLPSTRSITSSPSHEPNPPSNKGRRWQTESAVAATFGTRSPTHAATALCWSGLIMVTNLSGGTPAAPQLWFLITTPRHTRNMPLSTHRSQKCSPLVLSLRFPRNRR